MVAIGRLDDESLLAHLIGEIRLFLDVFARCDPATPVPSLDWDVRAVVTHTGAVHRWAAEIVTRRLTTDKTGGSAAFWPLDETRGDRLAGWCHEGATALVTALREAPPNLSCFTLIPDVVARSFWIRRQAHETAIHRADLEAVAGGPVTPVDASFAQDGIAELVGAFATEAAFATDRPGQLLFDASDGPGWLVTFGGERNRVVLVDVAHTHADAVVRGTSDELYRGAWNRPSTVVTSGDAEVLASWHAVRVQ